MVDMDKVTTRVLRGAYTSVGVFVADNIEDQIEKQLGTSGMFTNLIGAGVGLGASVGADELTDMMGQNRRGVVNDFLEYGGYGVQGASFNNLLENTNISPDTSGRATGSNVIRVDSNAGRSGSTAASSSSQSSTDRHLGETAESDILLESV